MANQSDTISISIDDLVLDIENPRLADSAENEKAALNGILADQKTKLAVLAEDIAEKGLSPIEFPIVFPAEDGKYVVAEGNRRIAAVKLVRNPSLIADGERKLRARFEAIKRKFPPSLDRVNCVVIQSESERNRWIRLRHTGQNEGRGLVEWGAKEQTRFNSRHKTSGNRMEFGLRVVELLQAKGDLTAGEDQALKRIPITTFERMLGDPAVRSAIGIERSADGVVSVVDDEGAVINSLKTLALEIANKEVKVGDIIGKDDRAGLVAGWSEDRKPGIVGEPAPKRLIALHATTKPLLVQTPQPKRSRPRSPDDRKVLVPSATSLNIGSHYRIRRIFIELKKIEVEGFENAVAVLLRVFLELSIEAFLNHHKVSFSENEKLRLKMEKVALVWESSNILRKNQITPWRKAASSNVLFSLNVLHSYVHSANSNPKKSDLIKTWDDMEFFFRQLWP